MNQAELQNDHGTITSKLSQFLFILTLDLVSSSAVQFTSFNKDPSWQIRPDINR